MSDLISVIVPIYNVQPYIERAVWSLILQTYENIQIILIDDGSLDESGRICERIFDDCRKRFNSIRENEFTFTNPVAAKSVTRHLLIRHIENSGQSHARNVGLSLASGEWIGFLDGDDACDWKMYQTMHDLALEKQASIIECNFSGRKYQPSDKMEEDAVITATGREALCVHLDTRNGSRYPSSSVWSKLFRKDIIDELRFPDGKVHEEYAFIAKALSRCDTYAYINKKLYQRTLRSDSTTAEKFSMRSLEKLEVFEERAEFLAAMQDSELTKYADAQYYSELLHDYYLCLDAAGARNTGTGEEKTVVYRDKAEQIAKLLREKKKDVLASPLPDDRLRAFQVFYVLPGLYQLARKLKTKLNKQNLKKIVILIVMIIREVI